MTTEQIQERIKEKQEEIVNLEAAHQKFLEQFNKQVAQSRDQYNRIQGEISAYQAMLNNGEKPVQ